MGRREQQRGQEEFWIAHTELPRTVAHPFYEQLNRVLEARGFGRETVALPAYCKTSLPWITATISTSSGCNL
jgi:hypothetical protein